MKLLLENWRQYLSEAAKGAGDLPDGVYISYSTDESGADFWYASDEDPEGFEEGSLGRISIARAYEDDPRTGKCGGAFKVVAVNSEHGWGPLLYDIAMEYATENGGGLMADREGATPDARNIWDHYLNSRKDVTAHQLGNLENAQSPDEEHDCDQRVTNISYTSTKSQAEPPGDWQDSALSKRYTKETTDIPELEQAGKWRRFTI